MFNRGNTSSFMVDFPYIAMLIFGGGGGRCTPCFHCFYGQVHGNSKGLNPAAMPTTPQDETIMKGWWLIIPEVGDLRGGWH